jgi:hypothetical protein
MFLDYFKRLINSEEKYEIDQPVLEYEYYNAHLASHLGATDI